MKKEILIIKNSSPEGPGLLEELLSERNIAFHITDLDRGEPFPEVSDFGAVVVLGGPDSANDQNDKMAHELMRIRQVLDAKIPYLGICLGLQTLVKAAGGKVVKSPMKEVGFKGPDESFFTVELTSHAKADPLFKGLDSTLNVFHLHGETVELTKDMILLAKGKFCPNQVVKIGTNAYGIQCHFELTPTMFEEWITGDEDLLQLDTESLRADFESMKSQYRETGLQLFNNFLDMVGY
ncbi:MAG: type 1 glutamine amidotransferase [Candidatus Saccharibacteria bacterium]